MLAKIVIQVVFSVLAAVSWLVLDSYDGYYLERLTYSLTALAAIYLLFKLLLEEVVVKQISDAGSRYSFRRAVSILNIVAFVVAGIAIWVTNTQTLLVSYGLIAAGVAVALQDLFKNVVGGAILFTTGLYRVGDRIEVNEKSGDVVDIGLQYTLLLEIQEWIKGDQPTGRLITVPNGHILSYAVHNYTRDHQFIWDELFVPVTYDSNWKAAAEIMLETVNRETEDVTQRAHVSLQGLSRKYFLPDRAEVPAVYLTLTDNWIELHVRYVTDVRGRRELKNNLGRMVLERLERAKDITVASETMAVTVEEKPPGKPRA